jgi:hypothetical protein
VQNLHQNIMRSLDYLSKIVDNRLKQHFDNTGTTDPLIFPELKIEEDDAPLNHFLEKHQHLTFSQTLLNWLFKSTFHKAVISPKWEG